MVISGTDSVSIRADQLFVCALSAIISHIPGVVSCGGSDCTNNSLIGVCTVNDLYQISHVEVTMLSVPSELELVTLVLELS